MSTPHPNDLVRAELVNPASTAPIRVIVEQPRFGWVGKAVKWLVIGLFLLALTVPAMIQGYVDTDDNLPERWHSLSHTATDKIAIITVEGTIAGDENFVKKQIDQVRKDDDVKAIVLRVDSPGGTVTGSDYIYHHLNKLTADRKIPLVVSMGSIAASGGYYVAMAAGDTKDVIFAEPTTWTGSIGVIIPHYNFAGLLEKYDVKDDSIASNPLKMMGSPTRQFPEAIRAQEQEILKGLVDSSFEGFKEIVLKGRPALRDNQDVQNVVFTGRIFTAKQAKENLLVDKLGFIEDAIDRAIELANLDRDDVRVVKFRKQSSFLEQLFSSETKAPKLDLSAILELAVPKAYYMCTWQPE